MYEDSRIIERTLAGDREAFGLLVSRYQDRLFATLLHVTGSREEAEDVVQETFVQAYTKLAAFQGRSQFYTWLYRIAFNLWSSRRRRRRAEVSMDEMRERAGQEPVDGGDSATERLEKQEQARMIHEALARLDEEHRAILVLREFDDCDYETIGEVLELAAGTVRSRLHRARLQLKLQLEQMMKEPA